MRVLFLTRDLPFPANSGYRKRNFYLIKELANKGIDVALVTRKTPDVSGIAINELEKYCSCVKLVKLKESRLTTLRHLIRSLFSCKAFSLIRRFSGEIKKAVKEYVEDNKIDIIICDSVYQSLNVLFDSSVRTILYEHNVESIIIERYIQNERNIFKKTFAFIEYLKLERFQKKMWMKFDAIVACSTNDKRIIEEKAGKVSVYVVNNGVDIEYFRSQTIPRLRSGQADNRPHEEALIYTGQIGWQPNEDAIMHFIKNIFPLIKEEEPQVKFWIVGDGPSSRIKKLAERDKSIIVTGFVNDVREFLNKALVYIVPLRIGSGTRLKILEALSMKKAVVSTSIGCEGLGLEDNKHLLVRDNTSEFAEAVLSLLRDRNLSTSLGENGRKLVEEKYDWNVVFKELDKVLENVKAKQCK